MNETYTFVLLPFMVCFLLSVYYFYTREGASSILRSGFLMAVASMLIAGVYLLLGAMKIMPQYGPIGFGLLGVALMVLSIVRIVRL